MNGKLSNKEKLELSSEVDKLCRRLEHLAHKVRMWSATETVWDMQCISQTELQILGDHLFALKVICGVLTDDPEVSGIAEKILRALSFSEFINNKLKACKERCSGAL